MTSVALPERVTQDRIIALFRDQLGYRYLGNWKYGTIAAEEKYFLRWKEDEKDNQGFKLDKYLAKMCNKKRALELMHDFVLFDGGRRAHGACD